MIQSQTSSWQELKLFSLTHAEDHNGKKWKWKCFLSLQSHYQVRIYGVSPDSSLLCTIFTRRFLMFSSTNKPLSSSSMCKALCYPIPRPPLHTKPPPPPLNPHQRPPMSLTQLLRKTCRPRVLGEWHHHQPTHHLGIQTGHQAETGWKRRPFTFTYTTEGASSLFCKWKNRLRNQATCSLEYSVTESGFLPVLISFGPVDGLSYDFKN